MYTATDRIQDAAALLSAIETGSKEMEMQYLISKHISCEDFARFIESHNGTFVGERALESVVRYAEKEVFKMAFSDGFNPVQSVMLDGITKGIIAGVDAIVCY